MESSDLFEITNEGLTNSDPTDKESSNQISEESVNPQDTPKNEIVDKRTKRKRSSVTAPEIFVKGDRVIVDESQNPEWVDGSQIPHWIYTRRFYVISTLEDDTCEISLNSNGKTSGRISSRFLKKIL